MPEGPAEVHDYRDMTPQELQDLLDEVMLMSGYNPASFDSR
jgi:hypothetical protein